MSDLIYKNDGSPFSTEHTAKMAAGSKKLNAEIVKVDGGYAIKALDNQPDTTEIPLAQKAKEPEHPIAASPDVKVAETWRPKDATNIPDKYKEENFKYRLEYKDKRTIDKQLRLGWVIDTNVAQKMRKDGLLFADGSCDSTLIVGDTILMKLPKPRAEARKKYYQERTMDGMKGKKKEYDAKMQACGVSSIGDGINMTRGIV